VRTIATLRRRAVALPVVRVRRLNFGGPLGGASMLLASAVSIQSAAALATTTFGTIAPVSAAGFSFAFAALFLLAFRPLRLAAWSAAKWRDAVLLGLAIAAGSSCLYLALDHLPLGSAVTIEFLGPLTLAIVAARGRGVLGAAALALLGTALVSSATPSGDLAGVLLALAAAAGWAAYMLASRRAGRHERPGECLTVAMCVAALATAPVTIGAIPHLDTGSTLAVLLVVGVIGRVLPYRLELAALHRLSPATAGVLFSVEPAIAAVVGAVGLSQGFTVGQAIGILAVVVAGVLVLRELPEGGG
jgi:inner membrane transporter RhtA